MFDIMSIIGGFRASVIPILTSITPFFVLLFLIRLSYIIRDKMFQDYLDCNKELIKDSISNLHAIADHIESRKFTFASDSLDRVNDLIEELMSFELSNPDVERLVVLGKKIKLLIEHLKSTFFQAPVREMADDSFILYETNQASERTVKFKQRALRLKFNHLIEPIEVHLEKLAVHYRRKDSKILNILKEVRQRVAFFNIFNITEKIEMEKIDIASNKKKLKRYQEKLEEYDQVIGELLER